MAATWGLELNMEGNVIAQQVDYAHDPALAVDEPGS